MSKSVKRALSLGSRPREAPPWLMSAPDLRSPVQLICPDGRRRQIPVNPSLQKYFGFSKSRINAMFSSSRLD
jgi:hypothetical protein